MAPSDLKLTMLNLINYGIRNLTELSNLSVQSWFLHKEALSLKAVPDG